MTHTMHRLSGLDGDFVLHVRPHKDERAGSGSLLGEWMKRLLTCQPVNAGSPSVGTLLTLAPEELVRDWPDGAPLHLVFALEENLIAAIRMLQEAGGVFSVSVSVPWETLERLKVEEHLEPAGFQAELISSDAEEDWLERLLSLCGHLRLSPERARCLCEDIHRGIISPEDAASEFGRSCICGCFNTALAAQLFRQGSRKLQKP